MKGLRVAWESVWRAREGGREGWVNRWGWFLGRAERGRI